MSVQRKKKFIFQSTDGKDLIIENLKISYNWKGLKTKSEKYTWNADSNAWSLYSTNHRYYDEHNLIYERTEYAENVKDLYGQQMQPTYNKYYYALDLLNYLHATGGAGGLLMVEIDGVKGYVYTNANGNVEAIYSADANAELLAEYEYSAFGETRKQSGALSEKNSLRYSTRYSESNTGLYYYGYREYSPRQMKWLSKEPLGEAVDPNLYRFCNNNTTKYFDVLGNFPSYAQISLFIDLINDAEKAKELTKLTGKNEGDCKKIEDGMAEFMSSRSPEARIAWDNYVGKKSRKNPLIWNSNETKNIYDESIFNPLYLKANLRTNIDQSLSSAMCMLGSLAQGEYPFSYHLTFNLSSKWFFAIGPFYGVEIIECTPCKSSKLKKFRFEDNYEFPPSHPVPGSGDLGEHLGVMTRKCGWSGKFKQEGSVNFSDR